MLKLYTMAFMALTLSGCMQPVDELQEIKPNETAFLVSLEGDTDKNQAKFASIETLAKDKISAKRVVIPHKLINICPSCLLPEYKDVPTARLFKVDRSIVSREWTRSHVTGTSAKDQSISVESNESIDFDLGATLSAHVAEEGTAKFLYFYAGRQLADIIDSDVRNFISSSLSTQFGSHSLNENRLNKVKYFAQAKQEAQDFFKEKGIVIDSFGFTEGMTYHDVRIQDSINKRFAAEQERAASIDLAASASTLMASKDAVLMQQTMKLRELELENTKAAIARWNGALPTNTGGAIPFINIK
jgi:hypothetical protein